MDDTDTAEEYTAAQMSIIPAVRTMYDAACFVGDPTFIGQIKRAWFDGDLELLAAHADGLVFAVSKIDGGWSVHERLRDAQRAITVATSVAA